EAIRTIEPREAHAPRVELDGAVLYRFDRGTERCEVQVRWIVRGTLARTPRIPRVLGEEAVGEVAAGTLDERERAVGDLRQEHVGNGRVVAREIRLGRLRHLRQRTLGVRDGNACDRGRGARGRL